MGLTPQREPENAADPHLQIDPRKRAKLTASDGAPQDALGLSVAISGNTVVVGAYLADVGGNGDQGAAYVFVLPTDTWSGGMTEVAKLTASDGDADDFFGLSVAIDGDTVIVGAPHLDNTVPDPGSAYVFARPAGGWSGSLTETATLVASDGQSFDSFGVDVAVHGGTIVVGANSDDFGGNVNQGSAYVFVEPGGGWGGSLTETAKLIASDGRAQDRLGIGVAIDGGTVAIGAAADDVGVNTDQGSAYVFVEPAGGWGGNLNETARLTASDGAADDLFAYFVAVEADTVVVGSLSDDIGRNTDQGSAYVFVEPRGGWGGNLSESAKLTASDGSRNDWFGHSVAISGHTVVAGARIDDVAGRIDQGSAYVFVEPAGGWSGNLNEELKLTDPDGAARDEFGASVAVGAGTIVVGAFRDDIGTNADQGSAHLFVLSDDAE